MNEENDWTQLVQDRKANMTSESIKDKHGNDIDWFGLVSKRRNFSFADGHQPRKNE